MIYTPLTKKALRLCFDSHRDQVDKTGLPYVFHPFHLAVEMNDEYSTVVALLHDVVEDTELTLEDIAAMGYPKEVVDALALLTHAEGVPYMDYVLKIAKNPLARRVKIADLKHNSDMSRLDTVDDYALKRAEKYKKALEYLESAED